MPAELRARPRPFLFGSPLMARSLGACPPVSEEVSAGRICPCKSRMSRNYNRLTFCWRPNVVPLCFSRLSSLGWMGALYLQVTKKKNAAAPWMHHWWVQSHIIKTEVTAGDLQGSLLLADSLKRSLKWSWQLIPITSLKPTDLKRRRITYQHVLVILHIVYLVETTEAFVKSPKILFQTKRD